MKEVISKIEKQVNNLYSTGKYKMSPVINSPMSAVVKLSDGREVINLCSNNYLGLANHPDVIAVASKAMEKYGYGTSSVRFICGTFTIHNQLEKEVSEFLGMESATTYVSCWNANEALIPTLLAEDDVVISDELNHASIIDACRLCDKKVNRFIYKHNDMYDLSLKLKETTGSCRKLIITDGVFSMEGDLANLPAIMDLAEKYQALVAVDDSHAHGVIGKTGKGTPEYFNVKVDIVTGTFGKALGGASGGFVASNKPIIELLLQKSRPQLFSNALPPVIAGGALAALKILRSKPELVEKLRKNVAYFRDELLKAGFNVMKSHTAIVPIIVGDTLKAIDLSKRLLERNILITGFGYPVVPEGKARLRAQVSAAHTQNDLERAMNVLKALKSDL